MSEETPENPSTDETPVAPAVTEVATGDSPKIELRQTLRQEVKDALAQSAPFVREAIVKQMIQTEVEKRIDLAAKAVAQIDALDGEINKYKKPDVVNKGLDGEILSQSWKPETIEANKKAKEKRQKLVAAFEKAMTDNDWEKLKSVLN